MEFGPLFGTLQPGSKAFKNFTNRVSEQDTFRRWIDAAPGQAFPVLAFYGIGGAGKSWLLQKLAETTPQTMPVAKITFDPASGTSNYATDYGRALSALRRQFGDTFCPRFDLAYAWIRFKEGSGDEPALRISKYAATAWDLLHAIADAGLSSIPGGNLITWFSKNLNGPIWRRLKDSSLINWLAQKSGEVDFLTLKRLNHGEIYEQLSQRLLQDLAEFLLPIPDRRCRAVLMIDGYEWRGGGQLESGLQSFQDLWVRQLYHPHSPFLIVIAGRDRLTWGEIDPRFQQPEYLEQHLVGGFSETDAHQFLQLCGVDEVSLRQAILRVSRDIETPSASGEQSYHAFSLGVCADTVNNLMLAEKVVDPDTFNFSPGDLQTLATKFLDSLKDPAWKLWLRRLAVTPDFDELAGRAAWSAHRDVVQDAAWTRLDDLSFVLKSDKEGWLALHPRMRAALIGTHPSIDEDRIFWQKHWQGRQTTATDEFSARSWLHQWQLDPDTALKLWIELSTQEYQLKQMATHFQLLEWWQRTSLLQDLTKNASPTMSQAKAGIVLGNALLVATLGSRALNVQLAIDCFQAALRVYKEIDSPKEWALVQHELGTAHSKFPLGDRSKNLLLAIDYFQAALRVLTEAEFPKVSALIRNNLGNAYSALPTGSRSENLQLAIHYYHAALRVLTKAEFPQDWALIQINLGLAYSRLPTGDRSENLLLAINCYQAAVCVYKETEFPQKWALTQNNLGMVYLDLPTGDRSSNLQLAIDCSQAALRIYTELEFPQEWALTQNNLGNVYAKLPTGNRTENLQFAISHHQAALRVLTETEFPQDWASTQNSLGNAYSSLPTGDNSENLQRAIDCYQAALRIQTEAEFPQDWAFTQNNLGTAYAKLPTGNRAENLQFAIDCYQAALRVLTEAEFPQDWASTQYKLGTAFAILPTENRNENLLCAIACIHAALSIYTEADFPQEWASTQINLGNIYSSLPARDRSSNLRLAIKCFQAALRIYTEAEFPQEWALTQSNLGATFVDLPTGNRDTNLQYAIDCSQAALRIYTELAFPREWARTKFNLAVALYESAIMLSSKSHANEAARALEELIHGLKSVDDSERIASSRQFLQEIQAFLDLQDQ